MRHLGHSVRQNLLPVISLTRAIIFEMLFDENRKYFFWHRRLRSLNEGSVVGVGECWNRAGYISKFWHYIGSVVVI